MYLFMPYKNLLSYMLSKDDFDNLENKDIYVDKVKLYKEKMSLNIKLKSIKLINFIDLNNIKQFFQNKFNEFDIVVEPIYNIDGNNIDKLNFYKQSIIDYIQLKINSYKRIEIRFIFSIEFII